MKIRGLSIEGAFEITPMIWEDDRGSFLEWFRFDHLAAELGRPFTLAQANVSVSAAGVVRGIHFADVPPGQAKYVTCTHGVVYDVIVDVRVGSPTYGRWEAVRLDDTDRRAVYLAEGLGHGFCALTDQATLTYLCSTTYNPGVERGINPLDPGLGIVWPTTDPRMSERDARAPSLGEAETAGLLPEYGECAGYLRGLRAD